VKLAPPPGTAERIGCDRMDAGARERFDEGMRLGAPLAVASVMLGVSFGVAAEPVMGAWAACAFSAFVFAGAAQFAATAVLAAGGSIVAAIVAGVLLNLRFLPMSVSIAPTVRGPAWWRALQGMAIVDASWALSSEGHGRFDPVKIVGATVPAYPAWLGGTVLGAFGGDLLGDPEALGLDAIFPAFFLGLLFAELRDGWARASAVLGAVVALALTPLTPAGVPILAASAAALIALRR
jgi:predicted branched-subunit amino acid permease